MRKTSKSRSRGLSLRNDHPGKPTHGRLRDKGLASENKPTLFLGRGGLGHTLQTWPRELLPGPATNLLAQPHQSCFLLNSE